MSILTRQNPLFNEKEQQKLKNMVAFIAGVGGLGTNQAQQLQRIGIKKIYLYDHDIISESNLNRQIFYGKDDISKSKVKVAKKHLDIFNLRTKIEISEEKITSDLELPEDVDIIFDALDNFQSRFELEKIANENNLPLIHGGVESWYGQITSIIPNKTVSLKEVFSDTLKESEESSPVFSPVVTTIASLQIIEGIKVYLNRDDILLNKLLIIDLKNNSIDTVKLN